MKKLLITLVSVCIGLTALSVPNSDDITLTEQLQAMSLSGYVRLGDVDANGWVPVEYVGTENVTMTATVNGSNVSIVNNKIKLPYYGTHVVVVTVRATGYATLTVTYDDVTREQDPHNTGCWVVLLDIFGIEEWIPLLDMANGQYMNVIDIYPFTYGDYVVYFHFSINGEIYGPPGGSDCPYFFDCTDCNPLVLSSTNFFIESGYSYIIGIKAHVNEDYEICGYSAIVQIYSVMYSHIEGDVNGDYSVNISDVASLIDYLLTDYTSIIVCNADLDGDRNISISDVTALIDMLLN